MPTPPSWGWVSPREFFLSIPGLVEHVLSTRYPDRLCRRRLDHYKTTPMIKHTRPLDLYCMSSETVKQISKCRLIIKFETMISVEKCSSLASQRSSKVYQLCMICAVILYQKWPADAMEPVRDLSAINTNAEGKRVLFHCSTITTTVPRLLHKAEHVPPRLPHSVSALTLRND